MISHYPKGTHHHYSILNVSFFHCIVFLRQVNCVLVDEAQFLDPSQIDQLRAITLLWNVPVICYGLRTDFRTNLFPGSKRLMEVADAIEEVKTTCQFCNKKAVFNLKHVNGRADCTGPAVQLGAEEKYFPTCFPCYRGSLKDAGQSILNWEEIVNLSEKEKEGEESDISLDDSTEGEAESSTEFDRK